jgi:hypothetical protein
MHISACSNIHVRLQQIHMFASNRYKYKHFRSDDTYLTHIRFTAPYNNALHPFPLGLSSPK